MSINSHDHIYISSVSRSWSTLLWEMCANFQWFDHVGELMYWNVQKIADICTCWIQKCSILRTLSDLWISEYTPILLKIWYLYEKRFFWDDFNPELIPENWEIFTSWGHDLLRNYEKIIGVLESAYWINHQFIDNTKNIDCVDYLVTRKKTKIVILLRDPRWIMYSYIKSRIRKIHLPSNPLGKIKELEYFGTKVLRLLKNHNDIMLVRYEDLIQNPSLVIEQILKPHNNLLIKPHGDQYSHMIRWNHFMYWSDYRSQGRKSLSLQLDTEWKWDKQGLHQKMVFQSKNLIRIYQEFWYFDEWSE